MRKKYLDQLISEIEAEDPKLVARELYVERFGPKTSAWLMNEHRRQLHKAGAVDLTLPAKFTEDQTTQLFWFFLAIDFLRQRKGWAVDVLTSARSRVFRVKWLGWPHHARYNAVDISPAEMRPS